MVIEITFLIMENHGKIMEIVFLNFCGNPEYYYVAFFSSGVLNVYMGMVERK